MSRFNAHFSFKRSCIDALFQTAQRVKSVQGLRLLQAPVSPVLAQEAALGKLLVVVPRRVGNAVTRNRVRRRIKAVVYEHSLIPPQAVFILLVGPGALDYSPEKLLLMLKKLFKPSTPPTTSNEPQAPETPPTS